MKYQHTTFTLGLLGLFMVSAHAQAQSYVATQVFAADTSVTTGMGLGGCISICTTISTTSTPLGLTDSDVAFAVTVQSNSSHYGTQNTTTLSVWDNGAQQPAAYTLYPVAQAYTGYVGASNAGVLPMFPGGSYVAPVSSSTTSFAVGISDSGRILATAYTSQSPNFPAPSQILVGGIAGNDLYISAAGGGQWSKVNHAANINALYGDGVNDSGTVVGYTVNASGNSQAFYTDSSGNLQLVSANGASASALGAINDVGVAVGVMLLNSDGLKHVFTFNTMTSTLKDLGVDLGNGATDSLTINDAGQVIRGSYVYNPVTGTWALPSVPSLPATWSLADINDKGDILAKSSSGIYILQAVPEPSTMLLMSLGLVGVGLVSKRKTIAKETA